MAPLTMIEKVWRDHVVDQADGQADLLYVDLHLLHEASSPQAFHGLSLHARPVRRPDLTLAMEDHNVPTDALVIRDKLGRAQVERLRKNCAEHGIENLPHGAARQGIVHVVGPELGLVQPGMTIICGDSHTSTHGAFGALAFGVGTSDVEHVLATQTLRLKRPRTMAIELAGTLPQHVTAKDLALAIVSQVGANGANGHIVEYHGEAVDQLSLEGRMTVCNMSIEAGARAGLMAPDDRTLAYLRGRPFAPAGAAWNDALAYWRTVRPDAGVSYDRKLRIDVAVLTPFVTWGTHPGQAVPIGGVVPDPISFTEPAQRMAAERALAYMGLTPLTPMREIKIDMVFLGSCTNGRLEDLREAAAVLKGRTLAKDVRMLVVPGSMDVRRQAEEEGLHEVFQRAGAEWRLAGCSMCMGINADRVQGSERIAATSNRNYEGRQGAQARTHLVSPAVAAATAVRGRLTLPSDL